MVFRHRWVQIHEKSDKLLQKLGTAGSQRRLSYYWLQSNWVLSLLFQDWILLINSQVHKRVSVPVLRNYVTLFKCLHFHCVAPWKAWSFFMRHAFYLKINLCQLLYRLVWLTRRCWQWRSLAQRASWALEKKTLAPPPPLASNSSPEKAYQEPFKQSTSSQIQLL